MIQKVGLITNFMTSMQLEILIQTLRHQSSLNGIDGTKMNSLMSSKSLNLMKRMCQLEIAFIIASDFKSLNPQTNIILKIKNLLRDKICATVLKEDLVIGKLLFQPWV